MFLGAYDEWKLNMDKVCPTTKGASISDQIIQFKITNVINNNLQKVQPYLSFLVSVCPLHILQLSFLVAVAAAAAVAADVVAAATVFAAVVAAVVAFVFLLHCSVKQDSAFKFQQWLQYPKYCILHLIPHF